ncbi:hypothetical protein [Micromonospora sp. NPDC049679]|uniref:coiled-coil domain-containing protein n=1 Tax=Micromonospora sp. NPDC049679 TaxID=3155920 RepID=UPI0033E711AE
MTLKPPVRRTFAALLAVIAVTGSPAAAAPPAAAPAGLRAAPGDIDEGGTPKLREQLNAASKGFVDAKAALNNSMKRQKELDAHLKTVEAELVVRTETVGALAGQVYRTGRLGPVSALLNSGSPDDFVSRASTVSAVAAGEESKLNALITTRDQETRAKAAIDKEVGEQKKQLTVMAKRKEQAERALAAAGGGQAAGGVSGGSASAAPARRNPDGSFPGESCSVDDPTTGGCLTPRTAHALSQAKAAGFERFVACFRDDGGPGEHPLGRACDFAAQTGGFGGVASGGDRTYGNNLANYFINNADRLGVLYVIWFKRIWLPSSGWRAYNNGNGDPSSDHTNHVHLSMN